MHRKCSVSVRDVRDIEHTVEVTAQSLYEAVATALATFQQDDWVGEIGAWLTTISVIAQQPAVTHEVRMSRFPRMA
jgi:hypothetical protein